MNSTTILKLLCINFLIIICTGSLAQKGISTYMDLGSNNVSNGIFIKSAVMGFYKYGKNDFETGFQTNLKDNNKNGFSGYTLSASRNMSIKDISLQLKGFFTLTFPSKILSETNWGALMEMKHKRFEMLLGTNFRTYSLSQKDIVGDEIENSHNQIHEIYNLMYSFSYYLKQTDENWNLCLSVTNIDHFVINQETNPFLKLKGMYKLSSQVSFFGQTSYMSAGVTNLKLNYFGIYFRTGIIWNIN